MTKKAAKCKENEQTETILLDSRIEIKGKNTIN